jgi:hypothetical protein
MTEPEILAGGCLCEALRYEITPPLSFVVQCCCTDCQKATGTGHTTIIGVNRSQLALKGEPATYTVCGDSGGIVTRHFCGTCGGRIYTAADVAGERIMVQAGSLDDPGQVTPQRVIYARSRVPWDKTDPRLPHFDELPERAGG